MTTHNLTYGECEKHIHDRILRGFRKDAICGCPRTNRTFGLYVYKHDITGNWVVWDVAGQNWLSLSGDWQTAMNSANEYLRDYPDEPVRCQSRCSQWPNCEHDWRSWHKRVRTLTKPGKTDIPLPADPGA